MTCKISVIVPIYNAEEFISQCIESILKQTLKDIEIICVNDGSQDSSESLISQYKDERIILVNKPNEGYGCACNFGLKIARGEYISIVEADDFIDKYMFEELYRISNGADIIKSAYYEYKDCPESIVKINWSSQYAMPQMPFRINEYPQFLYFHPSIWSCIYKRSFLKKHDINFVEAKGAGWADNPFQVQTLCLADKIVYTDNSYYYYRLTNPNSSSTVVNINNPFDRTEEVHKFLNANKINDENILAHLYKREFSYIDIVLSCISLEQFEYAFKKIQKLLKHMKKDIILNNKYINDYEKNSYKKCSSKDGILSLMKEVKERSKSQAIKALVE